MSISLISLDIRHERRVRLIFSNSLAAGAFGAPAPSYYSITNTDGKAPNPTIQAALVVSGSPNVVELVLGIPLASGAVYVLDAPGVPATDSTVTPTPSELGLQWGISTSKENAENSLSDRDRLLYGVDLLFDGEDYQETANGDLFQVGGTANVTKALQRGVEADELPYDPTYGAKSRQYVDSPSGLAGTLKGAITAQILRDPRVSSVKVTYEIDDDKTYVYAAPKLISGEPIERVTVEVPNQ